MTYEDLIITISEIAENQKIYKKGLILTYILNDDIHRRMNEIVFRKSNPSPLIPMEYSDEFEIETKTENDIIVIKFIKEKIVENE